MTDETTDTDKNNRKHTRIGLEIKASVTTGVDSNFVGTTKNMSFGGAFISVDSISEGQIPIGADCELELQLGASDKPLRVPIQSRVARTTSEGIAVEFCSTTIEGYWHFKNLMVYNSPEAEVLLAELELNPGLIIQKGNE